jgi:hypothetical protein
MMKILNCGCALAVCALVFISGLSRADFGVRDAEQSLEKNTATHTHGSGCCCYSCTEEIK